jgi:malonate-semialdehyde dehydrogenase (acetylating)/methylmalonate-semialdehyde dehydrogenase
VAVVDAVAAALVAKLRASLAIYGRDGVRFYTRRKTVTQRWPAGGVREKTSFTFPSNG